jgi:glycogen debranching enzyme
LLNYFAWTGDKETVTKYWPDVKQGMEWLLREQDPDGNGYPNGNGMMEIHGLDKEMIDVVTYTQQALESAAVLATECGEPNTAREYSEKASKLKKKINSDWWHEGSKSFADFIGTNAEARVVIDAAIVRADTLQKPWAVAELKETKRKLSGSGNRAHVVYHNWVVNTPLETGVADKEKALAALHTTMKYENPFGVFVTGIDRTEEADSVVLKSRQKIFSYTGAVMTLPTGINAIAWARYGMPDQSLAYIKKLNRSFSYALPGSMYEVSPDFGMFTQAWNIYGVAVPIVNYFFGIQPRAYEQTVHFAPAPPGEWKSGTLKNVPVGNNSITVNFERHQEYTEYRISQTDATWKITIDRNLGTRVLVSGKEVPGVEKRISLTGNDLTIQVYP